MRRSELLQGVRTMKFSHVYERFEGGTLCQAEAGELLGVGERTFRRWCLRYRDGGGDGLRDRRIDRVRQRGGICGVVEVVTAHAAMVAIVVGTALMVGGMSSAIASVCM